MANWTNHPSGSDHPSWQYLVKYRGAHRRVDAARGKAVEHGCSHCSNGAYNWAYDHEDPDEVDDGSRTYSLNPDHYLPLCKRCHQKFDWDYWLTCENGHLRVPTNVYVNPRDGRRYCRICRRKSLATFIAERKAAK